MTHQNLKKDSLELNNRKHKCSHHYKLKKNYQKKIVYYKKKFPLFFSSSYLNLSGWSVMHCVFPMNYHLQIIHFH